MPAEVFPLAKCILSSPQDETIPSEPDSMGLLLCVKLRPVIKAIGFYRRHIASCANTEFLLVCFGIAHPCEASSGALNTGCARQRCQLITTHPILLGKNLGRRFSAVYEEGSVGASAAPLTAIFLSNENDPRTPCCNRCSWSRPQVS